MGRPALEAYPSGPSATGYDTAYWEGLRDGRLVLPRCADCSRWRALGRSMCSECWSTSVRWDQVPPIGTVYTWIRTHRGFMTELDVAAPYVTVLVALDGAPVRLLGLLASADGAVEIGTRVAGIICRPDNAEWPVLRWEAA